MMRTQAKGKPKWSAPRERKRDKSVAPPLLSRSQREDLRLAAAQMTGAARRAFQAEMTLKYCHGSARLAETLLGWSRDAVEVGLAERRTGIVCLGGHAAWSGRNRWEEKYPEAAKALQELAETHAQQDPTFRTTLAYTRLTAKAAREALQARGIAESQLPSPSTMAEVLNRLGYRLRKVLKAKPQKKIAATDAIFANLKKRPRQPGNPRREAVEHGL
jgi:Rhodopirellula transposase DDE domain